MVFDNKFRVRNAIKVQKETLVKLFSLIKEYYPNENISISARLKNESKVKFENIEELINFDNYSSYKITSLAIDSSWPNLSIQFIQNSHCFLKFNSTIEISFRMDTKDNSIAFRAKVENIFVEMHQPLYYTIISKISNGLILWIICGAFASYLFLQSSNSNDTSSPMFIGTVLAILITAVVDRLSHLLFPPIQFLWGGETKRLDNIAKIKNNILWVIIFGTITAIIANIITRNI
jgi:hypothetical protein